jgi:hypothetical protein
MRSKFCAFIESFFGNILGETSPSHIIIPSCNGFTPSGLKCDKLNSPCEMLKPCENNASCTDDNTTSVGYVCSCLSYFNGTQCQYDHRPCKPDTCWNNGILLNFLKNLIKSCPFLFRNMYNSLKYNI